MKSMVENENFLLRQQILSRPQFGHHSNFEESIINHENCNTDENYYHQSSKIQFPADSAEKHVKRLTKKVKFADECGRALETFCAIEDLSNSSFCGRHKNDTKLKEFFNQFSLEELSPVADEEPQLYSNVKKSNATWKIDFIQPASEYLKFRETLEKNKIALENVILRNDSGKMLGTIKVANLSLQKNVFLRFTTDAWKSFIDCPGTYESSYTKPYETFAFETDIPKNEGEINKIEICVCYVADSGVEYWDSNNGQNYSLISDASKNAHFQAATVLYKKCDCNNEHTINIDKWIQFNTLHDFTMKD